jgi:hypothetical protein
MQELLGHKDIETTMICTHVANGGGWRVHSPLDRLRKPVSIGGGELCGPAGPHKTAEADCRMEHNSLQSKQLLLAAVALGPVLCRPAPFYAGRHRSKAADTGAFNSVH